MPLPDDFPRLTLRAARATPVLVPMRFALGTSAARVTEAPLLLIDLETEEGITGRTYLFCYRPAGARAIALLLDDAVSLIRGEQLRPVQIARRLVRNFALIGVTGAVRMALAGLDAAMWDALAVAAGLPLASLLGSAPQPIRAYNSCGLGLMGTSALADEAQQLLERGFRAVKLRLGYDTPDQDLAAVRVVRAAAGDGIAIMVDYNQALPVEEALRRCRALALEQVFWIEEPIRHDDLDGNARIAAEIGVPVQLGENFNGAEAMAAALRANSCRLVMPDVARIGGVTGWAQAAALAAEHGVPMSSHLFPEISAHLLAATPTADWLEYVDWADAVLEQPLTIADGMAMVANRPGAGLAWNVRAVERYRLT